MRHDNKVCSWQRGFLRISSNAGKCVKRGRQMRDGWRDSTMSRRAAKVDDNHAAVVAALRKCGAFVQSLAATGSGCPDLLVGYQGKTLLIEIKDGKKVLSAQKLTTDQQDWHANWRGGRLAVVNSIDAAIKELNDL